MNTGVKFDNRRRLTKPKVNSQHDKEIEKTRNPTPLALPEPQVDSPHGSFHSKMLAQHKQGEATKSKSPRLELQTPAEEQPRSEKIKVAVRIRPQLQSEVGKECVCHPGKSVRTATLLSAGPGHPRAGYDAHDRRLLRRGLPSEHPLARCLQIRAGEHPLAHPRLQLHHLRLRPDRFRQDLHHVRFRLQRIPAQEVRNNPQRECALCVPASGQEPVQSQHSRDASTPGGLAAGHHS